MRSRFLLALLFTSLSLLGKEYTLKRYDEVLKEKPDGASKYSRVWNFKQNPTIRVNLVEFTGEILLHKHPDAEHSLLVLEGQVKVQVANDTFVVTKGDFISIPANVPHKYWTLSKKAMLVSMDAPYYDPAKTIRLE